MIVRDDVSDRAEARVGKVLKGKWRLDSVLGIGGMASVYAATHRNRSRVAIKMLHAEVAISQDVTTRFLREGYVGNAVAHPGTVKVLDDDVTEDGAPFLVMELLEGEALGVRLDREGTLPATDVVLLADQLLDVLVAAHAAQIVHRDLKPDNVFVTLEGRLKVLDFGIARLHESTQVSSASTQIGSLLGTPAFMAPEQALGRWKEVDGRTDIWAVGATLFTLLTGRFVHESDTIQAQLVLAATAHAPSVRQLAPDTPIWLAELVDRALAFRPEQRFQDARSMQLALRSVAVGFEFPPTPSAGSAHVSGSFAAVSRPFTPVSTPEPRPSKPSPGHDVTLAAPEGTDAVSVQSGAGTFASVHGMSRSAEQPAKRRRAGSMLFVAVGLAACALGALVFYWRTTPAAGELHAPSATTPPVLGEAKPPPRAHAPEPPPSAVAVSPPPAVSLALSPVLSVTPPVLGVAIKKPPPQQPRVDAKKPPTQENLFDSRH